MPDLSIESGFDGPVIGVDEAGRGPWAGPVTIAAASVIAKHERDRIMQGLAGENPG